MDPIIIITAFLRFYKSLNKKRSKSMKDYFKYTGKDRKGEVIAPATAKALKSFCEQETEFQQAVEQSGKTFTECIDTVAKSIGNAVSDVEVFTKAVQFYFSEAEIEISMTINMSGKVDEEEKKIQYTKPEILDTPPVPEPEKKLTLDLSDLVDF